MKLLKKLRRILFIFTIKSPVTVLLIISISMGGLLYISYSNYTNVYVKASGQISEKPSSLNPTIVFMIDKEYEGDISKDSTVFWYTDNNGKRYNGHITEIIDEGKENKLTINIDGLKDEIVEINNKPITVEILVKKVRIIDKLLNKGGV